MITLKVGSKTAYINNSKFHSESITGMMSEAGDIDLTIDVPPKYWSVIGNYINFMHGRASEIVSAKKLADCFNMNTFFLDTEYLKYLIRQLYQHWSAYSQQALDSISDPDLLREIYLHLPLPFIPESYKLKPTFIKEWLTNENNKKVLLDGNIQTVNTTVSLLGDNISLYEISTKIVVQGSAEKRQVDYYFFEGYKLLLDEDINNFADRVVTYQRFYYESGTVEADNEFENASNKDYQLKTHYYENGQLKEREEYLGGRKNGLWQKYTEDGQLLSSGDYVNNKRDGLWYDYLPATHSYVVQRYKLDEVDGLYEAYDDQWLLRTKGTYRKGYEKVGQWTYYRPDGKYDIYSYRNDVKNGPHTQYDRNDNLLKLGQYLDNEKIGQWTEYDHELDTTRQGLYVNNEREGEWVTTDARGHIVRRDMYRDGLLVAYASGNRAYRQLAWNLAVVIVW